MHVKKKQKTNLLAWQHKIGKKLIIPYFRLSFS